MSLRGVAFMTVLTVSAVLESTLPCLRLSYKMQGKEANVTVLAVVALSVMTASPLKLNPPLSNILKNAGSTHVKRSDTAEGLELHFSPDCL